MRKLSEDDREMEIKLSCHDDKCLPAPQVFFYREETMLLCFLPALMTRLFILVPRSESQAVRNETIDRK